jgi:hypothetical protein
VSDFAATKDRRRPDTRYAQVDGEWLSHPEIARRFGMSRKTLDSRVRRGWSLEQAISGIGPSRKPVRAPIDLASRIRDNVVVDSATGCWVWSLSRNEHRGGYGQLHINRRLRRAHRISYEVFVGPVPRGMMVCHRCDNPPCCNPGHLYAGTPADNVRDMDERGRRVRCGKLSAEQAADIRARLACGDRLVDLAREFGVHRETIRRIKVGDIWRAA